MSATVERPDLSARTAVSKSALNTFDACQHAAWFDLHARRPLVPQERITFGSAVDRAVEVVIGYLRMGQDPDLGIALEAAREPAERDGVEVDMAEVAKAAARFASDLPLPDLSHARLQARISGTLEGVGEVDGHPDVWLPGEAVFDVKTSARPKPDKVSIELAFYALLASEVAGEPVGRVGYWTWVRTQRPYWQQVAFDVTPAVLQWAADAAGDYARARAVDERMYELTGIRQNWAFGGGPRFGCASCQYADACTRSELRLAGEEQAA